MNNTIINNSFIEVVLFDEFYEKIIKKIKPRRFLVRLGSYIKQADS